MQPLLVVIDPVARRADGESVRVARDVLEAGAKVKIAVPDGPSDLEHMFAHRGRRRPVVVGDDRTLHRVVELLYRRGELGETGLSLIPVGDAPRLRLARSLGVPTGAVGASRAVLAGVERKLDLLVADDGGVVLGALRVRPTPGAWLGGHRMRVMADGDVLAGPMGLTAFDERPDDGLVDVRVRSGLTSRRTPVRVRAREVRVAGAAFSYRAAGSNVVGPVPSRTWTVQPQAWTLTVPG